VNATLLDVDKQVKSGARDVPTLNSFLMRLMGEPFLFARFSYGDEFTLHFGMAREAKHSKLRAAGIKYGTYILKSRGSGWLLKSSVGKIVYEGVEEQINPAILTAGKSPIGQQDIERGNFLASGTFVINIFTCFVKQVNGIGFRLDMSDGASFIVIPTDDEPLPDDSPKLPELSDWELETPYGTAQVGPGIKWEYIPTKVSN